MVASFEPGQVFGRLTVEADAGSNRHGQRLVLCRCTCGETALVKRSSLASGRTQSCGCLRKLGYHTTHGKSGSKAYIAWKNMRQRCSNPNRSQWKDWGGRGIRCDPAWDSFEAFFFDMGEPLEGQSLERKDNSAGYSKSNCVWASPVRQNNNRRNVRRLEFGGETRTIAEWARHLGISLTTLNTRLVRGWTLHRALTAGKHHRFGKFTPTTGDTR